MAALGEADRDLIALLRENARMPVAEIARRLGVSRTTVQSRLERLEARGAIAGYAVRLGEAAEAGLVRAHVLLTATPKRAPRVVADLERMRAVRSLSTVSGTFDMIALVEAASTGDLDRVIDAIGAIEGVERTMSAIILSTRFER